MDCLSVIACGNTTSSNSQTTKPHNDTGFSTAASSEDGLDLPFTSNVDIRLYVRDAGENPNAPVRQELCGAE